MPVNPEDKKSLIGLGTDDDDIAKELYKKNIDLFKERKRTAELLYRVSEAIYATDQNNKITLFNHTLEKMLRVEAEEVMGKDVAEVVHLTKEDGEAIDIHEFSKEDFSADDFPTFVVLRAKGKDYYVHVKISTIDTKTESKEYLVTMSDITQEKELEKEKDEFISITSHELKTPMSIIKSYLWMLQSGRAGDLTDKQKDYVDRAMHGSDRLVNLITDMLKISRMEQGKLDFLFERINLEELIDEYKDEFELLAKEKELKLSYEFEDNLPPVYSDKNKLGEIVMNLMSNAVKYTESGSVHMKCESMGDGFVKLSVKDTGIGIDSAGLKKLFKKFQRLDHSYETMAKAGGTGLGLYIIKLYIANLGGSVQAESEGPGKGSTFWVTLPTKKEMVKDIAAFNGNNVGS